MNISSITKSISTIVLAVAAFSASAQEPNKKKCEKPERQYRWEQYDYFYGPDGYYTRLKSENNRGYEWKDFYQYKNKRRVVYPVFRKAKYAEDWRGRGYLYPASNPASEE